MEEIGKILPVIFKNHVRRSEPPVVEILAPLWTRVVGKAIAEQCRPVAFSSGTLTLATSCPTWAAELRRIAEEIRAETNGFLGRPVVRKLRVEFKTEGRAAKAEAGAVAPEKPRAPGARGVR